MGGSTKTSETKKRQTKLHITASPIIANFCFVVNCFHAPLPTQENGKVSNPLHLVAHTIERNGAMYCSHVNAINDIVIGFRLNSFFHKTKGLNSVAVVEIPTVRIGVNQIMES